MWLSMTSFPTVDQTSYAATTTDSVPTFAKNIRLIILNGFHNIDEVRIKMGFFCLFLCSFNPHAAPESISPSFFCSKETLAC